MKKKLEAELISIAHRVLKLKGKEDLKALQAEAQKLYEKLTLLKFIEDHFGEVQPTIGKNEVIDKFEELAHNVLDNNQMVPETNPHAGEEDLMVPGIETIKEMVEEMPETLDDILADFKHEPAFIKREIEIATPTVEVQQVTKIETRPQSLNDRLKHGFHIGLNDRLAFVKHLFDGSDEDFNRVISQINTFDTEEEAKDFIAQMVKPDYNHWEGKESYENRFLEILESKFN